MVHIFVVRQKRRAWCFVIAQVAFLNPCDHLTQILKNLLEWYNCMVDI